MRAFYEEVSAQLEPHQLWFMNYGYAGLRDYSWLKPSDKPYKYNLALIHHLLKDVPTAGASVLECGSGRGGNCHYLREYTSATHVWGMDICEAHVRICAQRFLDRKPQMLCADAAAIPFVSRSLDILVNLESSHCYQDLPAFLSEVRRVLRPGGYFAYADFWFLDLFPYDWTARYAALMQCGLLLERHEDISEGVFLALQDSHGLSESVRRCTTHENGALIAKILNANEAMRLSLAVAKCRYYLWLFRKVAD